MATTKKQGLRYVGPEPVGNFIGIPGVPCRHLSSEEAERFAQKIAGSALYEPIKEAE